MAEWAKSVLLWFCCTKRPLTIGALAGTPTKKSILRKQELWGHSKHRLHRLKMQTSCFCWNVDFGCSNLASGDCEFNQEVLEKGFAYIIFSWTTSALVTIPVTICRKHYASTHSWNTLQTCDPVMSVKILKHPTILHNTSNSRCSSYSGPRKKWSSTKRVMRADLFQQNGNTLHLERAKSLETSLQLATAYGLTEVVEYLLRTTHGGRG